MHSLLNHRQLLLHMTKPEEITTLSKIEIDLTTENTSLNCPSPDYQCSVSTACCSPSFPVLTSSPLCPSDGKPKLFESLFRLALVSSEASDC